MQQLNLDDTVVPKMPVILFKKLAILFKKSIFKISEIHKNYNVGSVLTSYLLEVSNKPLFPANWELTFFSFLFKKHVMVLFIIVT